MLTLDSIILNILLNARKSVHFYVEYLNHGKDCLRELNFDILKNVNTRIITLTDYKAAAFPCDYVDFVRLGVPTGQYVRPLLQYSKISNLNNFDSSGNKILYDNTAVDNNSLIRNDNPIATGINWCFGENGRWYGYGTGRERDVFKEIRARKEFQMDQHYPYDKIYLEYITDGSDTDAATQIHPYAQKTIEQYILWQLLEYNRSASMGEKREGERKYTKARDNLASRLSDITLEDVKRVYRRSYYGANKH